MGIKFNADEVLKIAEQIERNGAAFYRRAAELHPDEKNKEFLEGLAVMEDEHEKIFAGMREGLSTDEQESTAYDPLDQSIAYLETLGDLHGGEGAPDATAALTGSESMEDILRIAIELEKKSILFYLGVKDMVPAKLGKDSIDTIIDEEKSHVVLLSKKLHSIRD